MSSPASCGSCKKESSAPAPASEEARLFMRMADGRSFTDYSARCAQNNSLRAAAQAGSSYDYRMYLTQNAEALMKAERERQTGYARVCAYGRQEAGTMLPEQSVMTCDGKMGCSTSIADASGLGQGRRYHTESQNRPYGTEMEVYPITGASLSPSDMYGSAL